MVIRVYVLVLRRCGLLGLVCCVTGVAEGESYSKVILHWCLVLGLGCSGGVLLALVAGSFGMLLYSSVWDFPVCGVWWGGFCWLIFGFFGFVGFLRFVRISACGVWLLECLVGCSGVLGFVVLWFVGFWGARISGCLGCLNFGFRCWFGVDII